MQGKAQARQVSLSYVRAFVTLLVVAHHSVLAYIPYKPVGGRSFTTRPAAWMGFPIVDASSWKGFGFLVGWNDIFFMALMFFVSGLFVWPSLTRKGAGDFVRQRILRLGVPFALAAAVIAPLAYYPAYRQFGVGTGIGEYARAWLSLGVWPAGPAWFVWVLLVFDCIAALLYVAAPSIVPSAARLWQKAAARPIVFFLLLVALSIAVYVPATYVFGPTAWASWGPFFFQKSRALLYLAYFLVGVCAGAFGTRGELFDREGRLARRWYLWGGLTVFAFAAETEVSMGVLAQRMAFPVTCAASAMFLLAVFVRFSRENRWWDSLSANAYGIYLVHYVFVIWLQWGLVRFTAPAVVKGISVFIAAAVLSWMTVAGLRRSAVVARVI